MKKQKSFHIRILTFLLCTVFLFSTVFMLYDNTLIVKAVDESDLVYDAVVASLAAIGVYVTGGTLGALALAVSPILAASGKDIYHYVTDNGDGTTTISEDFVQIVLQAYNQYKDENAELFDGTMEAGIDGIYYFPEVSFTAYDFSSSPSSTTEVFKDIYTRYPCAILLRSGYSYTSTSHENNAHIIFYNSESDEFFARSYVKNESGALDTEIIRPANDAFLCVERSYHYIVGGNIDTAYFTNTSIGMNIGGQKKDGISFSVNSSCVPVYTNLAALKQGLRNGDFTAAYNYGRVPDCETSKYTGSYSGGDITVTNEKLGNIEDKLDEINETNKSIDDKLKDLLDWLGIGDGPGSGSGGIGAPSGWYEAVLAYLDSILSALEALVWIEADDSISEDRKDLFDLIDKIWEDPENGSQEAADAISGSFSDVARGLTKKFPFSIPWDIHALFSVFANAGNPEPAVMPYSVETAVMSYSAEPAVLYSDRGGIQTYTTDPEDLVQDVHNAPYFVLPLVIESWGINEQVVIDLKDFQTLSTLSRTLFSLLFAVFLIKFTISVIKIYKGGSDD